MSAKTGKKRASAPKKKAPSKVVRKFPEFPELVQDMILEQDAKALAQAVLARDAARDYEKARKKLDERGAHSYSAETMSGDVIYREYPEVSQMQDAWQRLLKIFKEFKLTLKEAGGKTPVKNSSPIISLVNER
jgi:hypothetical protein